MSVYNLVSFAGLFLIMGIAWLFSTNRRKMNFRVIIFGIVIQLAFAFFIFIFPPGVKVFIWLNDIVIKIMGSAASGAQFVFGRLALPPGTKSLSGEESLGFFLAFQGFPTIIFFSALMSILYYYGIMQKVIKFFALIFAKLMRISGAESLCTASNIFVGIESSLTVRPFLEKMTISELNTVLTAGMATVASNVLAIYIFSLQQYYPTIAAHLISASFLSAPAAIIISKIVIPETGEPVTLGKNVEPEYTRENHVFEAIINGANSGVKLIVGIVALLIAVLGLVALFDLFLGGVGARISGLIPFQINWSLSGLLGYLFYPITIIIGVPLQDVSVISGIIGERVIVTEVTAYMDLAKAIASGAITDTRSIVICVYALCGFAHVASLAIFIGGISAIAPVTTRSLSRIGLRALLSATLACLMTACIAGTFYTSGSILFGGN